MEERLLLAKISILLLGFSFALLGCQRDSISVYRVPKENLLAGGPAASAPLHGAEGPEPAIHWRAPAGWVPQPAGPMRLAGYKIPLANNRSAELTIVSLSGPAGGLTANVNRWRGQIALDPLDDAAVQNLVHDFSSSSLSFKRIHMVNPTTHKAIDVAFVMIHEESYFIKLSGTDADVNALKPDFENFLRGITHDH
jgi:hypothetical protein